MDNRKKPDSLRLFIAIDLPETIKEHLRQTQKKLPFGAGAQFSLTRDFHLTLKFLGECSAGRRKKVEKALEDIEFPAFKASLEPAGVFGGSVPRVVWVGMKVAPSLFETVRSIEDRMGKLGFRKEDRFVPHVTLARIKFLKDPKSFLAALSRVRISPLAFPVRHFYLFQSELHPTGAVHTKLQQFPKAS